MKIQLTGLLLIAGVLFGLAGCKEKWQKTESGLEYLVLKRNDEGASTKAGQLVKVHYTGTLEDSTKFDSSRDRDTPFSFMLGEGKVIKGWDEGLALMKKGERYLFRIPSELGYGEQEAGGGKIPANSTLIFDVELIDMYDAPPYNVEGKEPETTASGLKIYRMNSTDGVQPQVGQQVFVHYRGTLEDGTKFDSSWDRGQPLPFPLGQGRVIKGWDEGIGMLKVGEAARLVIPSDLGYGPRGFGSVIPPNSTLIFDVLLMDVK